MFGVFGVWALTGDGALLGVFGVLAEGALTGEAGVFAVLGEFGVLAVLAEAAFTIQSSELKFSADTVRWRSSEARSAACVPDWTIPGPRSVCIWL